MTARKHRIATRAALTAAIAVVVSLLFAAPAFAAAPTITSFAPTSGVVGATVTITGTGFNDTSPVTAVMFGATAATTFTVNSDTQITAAVPTGATTGTISVTDSEGTATSATTFTVTPSPTPTITSFAPTTGAVGDVITLTGTGFTGASGITFNGTAATTFTVDSDTSITVTVPTGATTGAIVVTTPGGTATSTTDFTVSAGPTEHDRDVSMSLRKHLFARGHVTSDLDACQNGVSVEIQRRRNGHWKTAGSATTNTEGHYRVDLKDKKGKYRAFVAQEDVNAGADTCLQAKSPAVKHHH
jgi:IPT/TIG domain-containing protein